MSIRTWRLRSTGSPPNNISPFYQLCNPNWNNKGDTTKNVLKENEKKKLVPLQTPYVLHRMWHIIAAKKPLKEMYIWLSLTFLSFSGFSRLRDSFLNIFSSQIDQIVDVKLIIQRRLDQENWTCYDVKGIIVFSWLQCRILVVYKVKIFFQERRKPQPLSLSFAPKHLLFQS